VFLAMCSNEASSLPGRVLSPFPSDRLSSPERLTWSLEFVVLSASMSVIGFVCRPPETRSLFLLVASGVEDDLEGSWFLSEGDVLSR
jgi:hypothetical protein